MRQAREDEEIRQLEREVKKRRLQAELAAISSSIQADQSAISSSIQADQSVISSPFQADQSVISISPLE